MCLFGLIDWEGVGLAWYDDWCSAPSVSEGAERLLALATSFAGRVLLHGIPSGRCWVIHCRSQLEVERATLLPPHLPIR